MELSEPVAFLIARAYCPGDKLVHKTGGDSEAPLALLHQTYPMTRGQAKKKIPASH